VSFGEHKCSVNGKRKDSEEVRERVRKVKEGKENVKREKPSRQEEMAKGDYSKIQ